MTAVWIILTLEVILTCWPVQLHLITYSASDQTVFRWSWQIWIIPLTVISLWAQRQPMFMQRAGLVCVHSICRWSCSGEICGNRAEKSLGTSGPLITVIALSGRILYFNSRCLIKYVIKLAFCSEEPDRKISVSAWKWILVNRSRKLWGKCFG